MFNYNDNIKPINYERWLFRMFRRAKNIDASEETLAPIPDKYLTDYSRWIDLFKRSSKTYVDEIARQLPEVFEKGPIIEIGKGRHTSIINKLQEKTNYPVKSITPFAHTFYDKANVIQLNKNSYDQILLEIKNAKVVFFQVPFFNKTNNINDKTLEAFILKKL